MNQYKTNEVRQDPTRKDYKEQVLHEAGLGQLIGDYIDHRKKIFRGKKWQAAERVYQQALNNIDIGWWV